MTKPVIVRTCKHCKVTYLKSYNHQIFCSPSCAFLSRVPIKNESECWEWTGSTHHFGYGEFRFHGFLYRSHRFSFAHFNKIPYESVPHICHHCDNPKCVNPHHLYQGNQKRNMEDMAKRNRHGMSKLSPDKVKAIKNLLKLTNMSQTEIGNIFSVSQPTISSIKCGCLWIHVQ